MANVIVDIESIVKNLGKGKITFLQPVYEAIVNSLEAEATKITVEFFKEDAQQVMDGIDPKVSSFVITDNGIGFTAENRASFEKLWTTHKIAMGCKGSGRFTWLNIFKKITIESRVAATNTIVKIPFSLKYGNDDIAVQSSDEPIEATTTTIRFEEVTDKVFIAAKGKKNGKDIREVARIDDIYNKILENLLVKLFLTKSANKAFTIEIKLGNEVRTISWDTIPKIDCLSFSISTGFEHIKSIDFQLFYFFVDDKKRSKKVHCCANERVVHTFDDDALGFSASLPNNGSFTMLLCSNYFDENIDDSRSGLVGLQGLRQPSLEKPLLMGTIIAELKRYINSLITAAFPILLKTNNTIIQNAIDMQPHLAKYIKENTDILISESSLIKTAISAFHASKDAVSKKFELLLTNAEIDPRAFSEGLDEVSEVALFELGEYIKYRSKIIRALEKALHDTEKKDEEFFHRVFMPKGKTSAGIDEYTLNNLWLLDDKFMTYSYVASDATVKKIVNEIEESDKKKYLDAKKPDLVVFYNRDTEAKDLVVVEFKSPNATLGEKEKSIGEIARNSQILKKNISGIQTVWSYILTTIDEGFEAALLGSEFKPLFTNDSDAKIFYRFFPNNNAHVYAIDFRVIASDASARNQTFLNILKKH